MYRSLATPQFQFALVPSLFRFRYAGPSVRPLLALPRRCATRTRRTGSNLSNPLSYLVLIVLMWGKTPTPPYVYAGAYPADGHRRTATPQPQYASVPSSPRYRHAGPTVRPLLASPRRRATRTPLLL